MDIRVNNEETERAIRRLVLGVCNRAPSMKHPDREDAVQTVLLKVLATADDAQNAPHLVCNEGLIIVIARNVVCDWFRKKFGKTRNRPALVEMSGVPGIERMLMCRTSAGAFSSECEFEELLEFLEVRAGQKVSETLQLLRHGYSHAEIAARLGISSKTVSRRITCAKRLIRNLLEESTCAGIRRLDPDDPRRE